MDRMPELVPVARTLGLVTNDVDDDVLVYDLDSHHLHHLNQMSATVWRLCTDSQTVAKVAIASGLTEECVRIALGKLADADLLVGDFPVPRRAAGSSRRALLKKGGMALAIPTVISITAPLAAQAASGGSGYYKCSNRRATRSPAVLPAAPPTSVLPGA
jgi:hypothetical protein